jgi:hypothetical protein
MRVLSGIIGSIVRLLTKAYPDWYSRVEGKLKRKKQIRPDKSLIRALVRNENFARRTS